MLKVKIHDIFNIFLDCSMFFIFFMYPTQQPIQANRRRPNVAHTHHPPSTPSQLADFGLAKYYQAAPDDADDAAESGLVQQLGVPFEQL